MHFKGFRVLGRRLKHITLSRHQVRDPFSMQHDCISLTRIVELAEDNLARTVSLAQCLPNEILDIILIEADQQTLRDCTLVCRRWYDSSSRLLLYTLRITSWNKESPHRLRQLLSLTVPTKTTSSISSRFMLYTRELSIYGSFKFDFLVLQETVMALHSLETLELIAVSYHRISRAAIPPGSPPYRRSLTNLVVGISRWYRQDVEDDRLPRPLDVLLWFEELQNLNLQFIGGLDAVNFVRTHNDCRTLVRHLYMSESCAWTVLFLARLAFDTRSLTEVTVRYIPTHDLDAVNRLFEIFRENLQRCTIHARAEDSDKFKSLEPGMITPFESSSSCIPSPDLYHI